MAASNSKLKLLYIMRALLEQSDEEHVLSAEDLNRILQSYGLSADRKTIYSDIETLESFGLDIVQVRGGVKPGYYIGSRDFELPELKLLVDAVQVSRFITLKKSKELIGKIEKLAGRSAARQLNRNVFIFNRLKAGNETIYYNVDQIQNAILENRQISFQYTEWNMDKELVAKRGGAAYVVSPWQLTWSDENYYLLAYEETEGKGAEQQTEAAAAQKAADAAAGKRIGKIKHYRVDKMRNVCRLADDRQGKDSFENFDLAEFARKTFRMYGGDDKSVSLICRKHLVGVILDRFGKDIIITSIDEEHFKIRVVISVSPQFFGWVTALGTGVEIEGPEEVREAYKAFLEKVVGMY